MVALVLLRIRARARAAGLELLALCQCAALLARMAEPAATLRLALARAAGSARLALCQFALRLACRDFAPLQKPALVRVVGLVRFVMPQSVLQFAIMVACAPRRMCAATVVLVGLIRHAMCQFAVRAVPMVGLVVHPVCVLAQ